MAGEWPELTLWSCLHDEGCPDMFWHSTGSPQPLFRILNWRRGTSWHRSPGCQTCFGFLLPWALNIQRIPTQTCTSPAQLYCIPGNNTTPTFFPLSIPFLITEHLLYSALDYSSFQHCMAFWDLTCRHNADRSRKGTQTPRGKWDGIEQYGVFRPLECYGYK